MPSKKTLRRRCLSNDAEASGEEEKLLFRRSVTLAYAEGGG